jgi:mannose-6-phosphate isomerase-like protein (cupin superfamily)
MLALHISQGQGFVTPPPFVREVRVLLSPLIQPELAATGAVAGYTEVAIGQSGSKHAHPDAAEVWMFFAGKGIAIVGDEQMEVGPGYVVYTPPGVQHQFINTGDEPVKLFWTFAPSGPERNVLEATFR